MQSHVWRKLWRGSCRAEASSAPVSIGVAINGVAEKYSVRPVALVNLNAPLHVKVHNINRRSSGIRARTRCTVRRTPVGYPVAITVHACLSSFHTHCCYSLELALKQVALDSSRCSSSFPSTATPMCIVLVKCLNILLRENHVVAPAWNNVLGHKRKTAQS